MNTTIKNYIAQGYSVVPIPPRSKGPTIRGWQKLRIENPDGWFDDGQNVGVILGQASGGLVCVDLDHPAAVELAEAYLPKTGLIAGRENGGKTHWFYRVKGPFRKVAFASQCRVKVIEILGDGQQVVVGPSEHPNGGRYDVLEGEAEAIGTATLVAACERLAMAVFAKLGLQPGTQPRQQEPTPNCAATNGSPHYGGGETDLRATLVEHGAEIFGDGVTGDGCQGYYIRCPRSASHTTPNATKDCMVWHGKGGGWQARCMHASCGIDSWATLREALDPCWRPGEVNAIANGGGVDFSGLINGHAKKDPTAIAKRMKELPDDCFEVPGLIGEIVRYTLDTSRYPQPSLALAGALALMATITARKVCDGADTRTNLYVVGIGDSGSGKNYAREVIKKIFHATGAIERYEEDAASAAAIHRYLSETPAGVLLLDEMGDFIAASRTRYNGNTQASQIVTVLNKLHSSANGLYKAARYADNSKQVIIDQPGLSLYGTTTGAVFWKHVQSEHLHGGIFRRLAIFHSQFAVSPRPVIGVCRDVPQSIIEQVQWWLDMRAGHGNLADKSPTPLVVEHTSEARERYERHEREITIKRQSEESLPAVIWSGTSERTAKLALLFACSRSPQNPRIEMPDINRAIRLSNLLARALVAECSQNVSETLHEANLKRVAKVISGSGKDGLTRNELTRKTQWLRGRERDEILRDLLTGGQVIGAKRSTNGREAEVFIGSN